MTRTLTVIQCQEKQSKKKETLFYRLCNNRQTPTNPIVSTGDFKKTIKKELYCAVY